ncbi:MAG: hypothetical protein N3A38_10640 [Planctomycetota bacterium]|nr:hypothetical protein [Planctomycetota bacterium]
MKERRNAPYLLGAALAVLLYAAAYALFVSPIRAETDGELDACRKKLAEVQAYYRAADGMVGLKEAHARLDEEARARKEVRDRLMKVAFNMPPEFNVPREWEPNVYFDRMLKEVVGKAGAAVQFVGKDAGTIGFTQRFLDRKEEPRIRFRRLAVADRLLEAMKATGVGRLVSVQHGKAFSYGMPDVNVHIEAVTMYAVVQSPEKNFVALVHELQQPGRSGRYVAVRGVRINVADPTSGTFEATLALAGLFVAPGPYVPPKTEGQPVPIPLDKY